MENKKNDTAKKVVLAIDDNPMQLEIFQKILGEKYKLQTANSASSAMNFLSSNADRADVILLDITMPNISGFEFLKEIRNLLSYMETPIIIVSGNTGEDYINEAKSSTAFDVLGKPVNPGLLIKTIEKALTL